MLKTTSQPIVTDINKASLFSNAQLWSQKLLGEPALVLVLTGVIAYWGVWQLGLSMDDYSNLEVYRNNFILDVLRSGAYNRFPVWTGIIYPLLLQTPFWFAHCAIIAAQIGVAILLYSVLNKLGFGRIPALAAGMLFLVWPSHGETVFWLVAAAPVLGALFIMAGLRLALASRYKLAVFCVFLGFLNSEGVILPGLFGLFVVLLYQRVKWWRWMSYFFSLGVLFGIVQVIRSMATAGQELTPYKIGLQNFWYNISHLSYMQIGQASSQDIAWLWGSLTTSNYTYINLLLDYNAILLAGLCAGILAMLIILRSPSSAMLQPSSLKFSFGWGGLLIIGWLAAMAIFTLLVGNAMQTRYTYSMTIFFCTIVALLLYQISWHLARLFGKKEQAAAIARLGLGCGLAALLTWSLFLSWSTTYRNWYPAHRVDEKMIADFKAVGKETGISQIYVVDGVYAVGNAYTISRFWAFEAVGRLFLDKQAKVTVVEIITEKIASKKIAPGEKFESKQCIFVSWQDGKMVKAEQLALPDMKVALDCKSGWITSLNRNTKYPMIYHGTNSSINIKEFGIKP